MAQPIYCDGCDGAEQATLLVTQIQSGDVLGLGPNCIPAWATAVGQLVAAELEHADADASAAGGEAPEGVSAGISPNNPATYGDPPAAEPTDPHGPAETGPATPGEVPLANPEPLDPEHPHTPAESGPGTYGEEGGVAPASDPAAPAPTEVPAEFAPGEAPPNVAPDTEPADGTDTPTESLEDQFARQGVPFHALV
jgi:hypothetical protein